jgi:hypothetical protein
MGMPTFTRGCSLALARLIRAGFVILVITIDLGMVSNSISHRSEVTYDATTGAGTTLRLPLACKHVE